MSINEMEDYQLEANTSVDIDDKYTYVVNSYFLANGSRDVKEKVEAVIHKRTIRTFEEAVV